MIASSGAVSVRGAGGRWRVVVALALVLALLATALGPPAPVGATTRTVTNGNDSGAGSLRATLQAASAGDTIGFDQSVAEVVLTSAALTLSKNVTIHGRGTGGVTVRRSTAGGTPDFRPFLLINAAVVATLQGLTISGGHTPAGAVGGGIYNAGATLTLLDCAVTRNTAVPFGGTSGEGGGVYQDGGALTLTNTTISENTAGGAGGGLYVAGATTVASNILISDNTTGNGDGGGIYQDGGTLTVTGANVTGNTAGGFTSGGGLHLATGTLTLTNSTITGNGVTSGSGGGISVGGGTVTLTNTTVSGNDTSPTGSGGGISVGGGTVTLTGSTVSENSSGSAGNAGGIDNSGMLTLMNSTISGNSAQSTGGIGNSGTLTLTSSTVTRNSSKFNGGGFNVSNGGTIALTASIVAGNTAEFGGADCSGTATSGGYNVVGGGSGCPSGGPGDLADGGALSALLNPTLADNGGPTPTHALPLGSPALDRVPVDQCGAANGADQRGVARPQGPGCDSGAFELPYYTLITGPPPALAQFPAGTNLSLTPLPDPGQIFIAWTLDGVRLGWFAPIDIYMDTDHTVQATYVPAVSFPDVPNTRPDFTAITELASRGTIRGYANGKYGPDDGVQRAQMAALIARATLAGPGTPTNGTLAPRACLATGTWDCEDWGNSFSDRNGLDANLWRNVGALQHYQVAFGYDGAACAARGVASPCYAPTASVSYVETIVFITRAMIAKGYWQQQPGAPQPYAGVPAVFAQTVATYHYYTAYAGGVPAPPGNWNAGATRGWFARALWLALDSYWGRAP